MAFHKHQLQVATRGKGLYAITRPVATFVSDLNVRDGLLTVFIQHTSASLTIQENADPDVLRDLADFFEDIAPEQRHYCHSTEGPDDMPAHIRSVLTQTSLSIPISNGRLMLGIWQGIYVFEHRAGAQQRSVVLQVIS